MPKAGGSSSGLKRGPSAAEDTGAPPLKKAVVRIVKSPGPVATSGKVAGLSAKVPAPASAPVPSKHQGGNIGEAPAPGVASKKPGGPPLMQTLEKRPAQVGPPGNLPGKAQPPPPKHPLVKDQNGTVLFPSREGTMPLPPAEGAMGGVVGDLVAVIEAAPESARLRHVVRLAENLGQKLPIDHINQFLQVLKKAIVERAKRDNVRIPPVPPARPATAGISATQPASPSGGGLSAAGLPSSVGGTPSKLVTPNMPVTQGFRKVAKSVSTPVAPAMPTPPTAQQTPPTPQTTMDGELMDMALMASPMASPEAPPCSPLVLSDSTDGLLLQLLNELDQDPVCRDGLVLEPRLNDVLGRLWGGVAKRPKDWATAWQAMRIPLERQAEVLQYFLNMAFAQATDPDLAPLVVAELVKGHKVKMRSVEEVLVAFGKNLDEILAVNDEAWHVYAQFLVHVFPKPAQSGWGWSRVGWSWQSWWQFVEKCIQTLEVDRAFDVVSLILRLVQDREGQPLVQLQAWTDGDKLQRVVQKLSELGACDRAEVLEKLSMLGVVAEA